MSSTHTEVRRDLLALQRNLATETTEVLVQHGRRQRNKCNCCTASLIYTQDLIACRVINYSQLLLDPPPQRKKLRKHTHSFCSESLQCIFVWSGRHGRLLPDAGSDGTSATFQPSAPHGLREAKHQGQSPRGGCQTQLEGNSRLCFQHQPIPPKEVWSSLTASHLALQITLCADLPVLGLKQAW